VKKVIQVLRDRQVKLELPVNEVKRVKKVRRVSMEKLVKRVTQAPKGQQVSEERQDLRENEVLEVELA